MPNTVQANKLINQAADLYTLGVQHASQYDTYIKRRDQKVKTEIGLLDDKHKALINPIKGIHEKLKQADERALKQEHQQAAILLDEVLKEVTKCKETVTEGETCARRLKTLKETTIPGLTTHKPAKDDPVIGGTIKALNVAITEVELLINGFEYAKALKRLNEMETTATSAALKKKVKAGGLSASEMTTQCKELLSQPGGEKELDDLVQALNGDSAVDAVLAAMKARFKLDDAECLGTKGDAVQWTKELCKIYQVMTIVPAKHTKENPSFKKITRRDKGSAYNKQDKVILMGEGHPDRSGDYPIGDSRELPGVESDCQPDNSSIKPKFFDWNTLHEIGHAMDDKKQFMNKFGSGDGYGGWMHHGSDLLAVAQAASDELALPGITAVMIAKYLENKTEPTPKPASWGKVTAWADAIREDKDPWENGALCAKSIKSGGFVIGTRIFHEAYEEDWYSYSAQARTKGITGYQFRAPGEWFSELYAAYKSGKLKITHPAVDKGKGWLPKLFGEKVPG